MARTTEPSGDALPFLQRRVGLFGATAGGLALTFYGYRLVSEVSSRRHILEPSLVYHVAAGITLIAMWLVLRGGP